jgi:predicted ATPase
MAIAHGGQILLSGASTDLVRDRLPAGCALLDLGEHRLKDLVQPEHVCQLCAPGLPTNFPPLNSLNAFPNNLPVQLTSFVGRARELAEVKQLLTGDRGRKTADEASHPQLASNVGVVPGLEDATSSVVRRPSPVVSPVRLLTLTGPGGTGKTRLSLQAAAEVLEAFPAGAWLVELAPLADPALVPQRVASVFGLRELPGHDIREVLIDYLRAKRLLLILDNCEHLIDTCAQLADELLRACPKLVILASSREALGIAGETAYRVPSLSCPTLRGVGTGLTPAHGQGQALPLQAYDAVQLFAARATAVQPRFALNEQNTMAVVQICQRLDGIPLAIELATARLKLFSAEQIAARLDDRFRLLTGGSRTALPRQQTLGALIDWSYDLLSEPERVLLRRLSVFAGGWSFEAAEAVCGSKTTDDGRRTTEVDVDNYLNLPLSVFGLPSADVLDLLAQLVNKSLVVAEEPDEQGEVRYHYLETIRQYARDKLLASGEAAWARDRHLAWFVRLSEESRPHMLGREQIEWQQRLERDHDNLRAALEWAVESDSQAALRMVGALHFFWAFGGRDAEGRRWAASALAAADRIPASESTEAQRAARAWAMVSLGTLTFGQGEIQASREPLSDGLALARTTNDPNLLVFALGMCGFAQSMSGDSEAGVALAREAMEVVATHGNVSFDAALISGVFIRDAIFVKHNAALAHRYIDEGLRSVRARGNPFSLAMTLFGAAMYESMRGEFAEARAHLLESQEWMRKMGNRPRVIGIQSELGHIARREGNFPEAIRLYREALPALQEFGHRGGVARNLECLAFVASAQRQPLRAARLMGAAEALRETSQVFMMPEEQPETKQEIGVLRAQLTALEFDAAWAEGRAMDMDQAIQYALRDE